MQGLHGLLGDNTEFVYLDGPFEAECKSIPIVESSFGHMRPFYEWMRNFIGDDAESTVFEAKEFELVRKIVAGGNKWPIRYGGIERALEYLDEQLEALGPFDVAVGFSQGGIMLTVYAMWCLRKHNKRRWKLMVMVSTPLVNAINVKHLFMTSSGEHVGVPFPSAHVVGKADWIRQALISLMHMLEEHPAGALHTGGDCISAGQILLEHNEGHRMPSFEHHRAMYRELARVMTNSRAHTRSI
ncbi:hypothetical protein PybrP1_009433 [[Pythium] brassicae (nom. inval.)]|nr:hypothetical protein PybrP1_009433 [[Pythium] brassicae (nom. inval.)]